MKKTSIIAAFSILLLGICAKPVHAEFDYYNNAAITKDADNNGNVTYTNKANGKTYTVYADGTTAGDDTYAIMSKEALSRDTVELGHFKDIRICLPYGQSKISNLKVKKGKGVISAKIAKAYVTKSQQINFAKEKDGTYFYRDRLTGQKINTGTQSSMYTDYADYYVRIYGKKLGKAVLEYQVYDSNGSKVARKKIQINVRKNGEAVISATFGGRSLLIDYSQNANNKKYIYYNGTKSGGQYTTKKSGKFKVKLSNDYRLKAIYVQRRYGLEKKPHTEKSYDGYDTSNIYRALDLNGDGDYNDVIDGISEGKLVAVYYEKIRNGQKIVLNNSQAVLEDEYRDTHDNSNHSLTETRNIAGTTIIVLYQDKRTGNYYHWKTDINRFVSKV